MKDFGLNASRLLDITQLEQHDQRFFTLARNFITGRRLAMYEGPMGFGVEVVAFETYDEVADAEVDWAWRENQARDAATKAKTQVPVPILRKDLWFDRRKLAASQRTGIPLDQSSLNSALYKMAIAEDKLMLSGVDLDGDGTYELAGYYTGAGNSYSTSMDWSTASQIPTSLLGAMALMIADNIPPPYNTVVNGAQMAELFAIRDYTDRSYEAVLTGMTRGNLYMSSQMTATTALMSAAPGPGWFDYALCQDLTIERSLSPAQNLSVRCFEALVQRIKDSEALCSITKC